MSRSRKILVTVVLILLIMQFFQPRRNKAGSIQSQDLGRVYAVPAKVHDLLKRACYDCHSNNTRYPWYNYVQPFGWILSGHIKKAKAELNFNEFGTYTRRRQISKLNGIANSIREGEMPLSSYTLVHKEARLSHAQKTMIIEWAEQKKDSLRFEKNIGMR